MPGEEGNQKRAGEYAARCGVNSAVDDLTSKIRHYRAKAAEADESAKQATDPLVSDMYLEAARSWRELVKVAEELQSDSKTSQRG
jgi:hypothetical protein